MKTILKYSVLALIFLFSNQSFLKAKRIHHRACYKKCLSVYRSCKQDCRNDKQDCRQNMDYHKCQKLYKNEIQLCRKTHEICKKDPHAFFSTHKKYRQTKYHGNYYYWMKLNNVKSIKDRVLCGLIDVNIRAQNKRTILFGAVQLNKVIFIKMFIVAGAKVNISDYKGMTPLLLALHKPDIEVITTLLNAGAKVNVKNKKGQTPIAILLNSSKKVDTTILKLLIQKGANTNIKINKWLTPLMDAVDKKDMAMFDILIHSKMQLNAIDPRSGETALMTAVRYKHKGMVQKLIHAGAKINKMNYLGYTALDISNKIKNKDILAILQQAGAKKFNYKDTFGTSITINRYRKTIRVRDYHTKKYIRLKINRATRYFSGYNTPGYRVTYDFKKFRDIIRNRKRFSSLIIRYNKKTKTIVSILYTLIGEGA